MYCWVSIVIFSYEFYWFCNSCSNQSTVQITCICSIWLFVRTKQNQQNKSTDEYHAIVVYSRYWGAFHRICVKCYDFFLFSSTFYKLKQNSSTASKYRKSGRYRCIWYHEYKMILSTMAPHNNCLLWWTSAQTIAGQRGVCARARMSNAFDRSDSIAVAPFCCSLRDTIVSEADTHTSLLLLEIWFNYVICLIFGQMRSRATMQIYFNGNATKQKKTKRGKNNRSQTGANEEIKILWLV